MKELVPQEIIEQKIFMIRGHKVMLDKDLAELYDITTFNLNKAVKRNHDRFPEDFMFKLTHKEFKSLTFQIGISKKGSGGRRYPPFEKKIAKHDGEIQTIFEAIRQLMESPKKPKRKIGFKRIEN